MVDDLTRMLDAQESVFGTGRGPSVESSLAELESGDSEFWVAEVGGRIVCGGRLTPVAGHGVRRHLGRLDAARLPRPRHLPRARRGAGPLGHGARRPVHPLRLHRHVAPDPRALGPAGRDHHDAVRLDPLSPSPRAAATGGLERTQWLLNVRHAGVERPSAARGAKCSRIREHPRPLCVEPMNET